MTSNITKLRETHFDKKSADFEKMSWNRREKDIYDQYITSYRIAQYLKFVPALISVFLASSFIFYHLNKFTGSVILSAVIAFTLLVILELIKTILLERASENYFQKYSKKLFLLALIPVVISILSSVFGAVVLMEEKVKVDLAESQKIVFKEKQDSLIHIYNEKLSLLKAEKKEFYENNTIYLGRQKYVLNNAVAPQYAKYDDRMDDLKHRRDIELAQINDDFLVEQQKSTTELNRVVEIVIAISLFVELLIISLNVFIVWFEVSSKEQIENFDFSYSERYSKSQVKNMFDNFIIASKTIAPSINREEHVNPKPNKSIGFQTKEEEKNRMFLLKYNNVVEFIKKGYKESQILQKTGISRSTYYNVKRVFDNI